MNIRFAHALLIVLLPVCAVQAQSAWPWPTTPERIAEYLTSDRYEEMALGLEDFLRLSTDQLTPDVEAALVQALKAANERNQRRLLRFGLQYHDLNERFETSMTLAHEVSALNDPATIPVLLPWLCCLRSDHFIDFGRMSFEPVLEFVATPQPGIANRSLAGGLRTLRLMVDRWGLSTFSAAQRERMKQVATMYITSRGPTPQEEFEYPVLFGDTITFAASLQDEELLQIARA